MRQSNLIRYRAFLSYCHLDVALARKLHRRIEEHELPRSHRRPGVRRPCAPIFLDYCEMGADAGLTPAVFASLNQSERLIVLCTPRSAKSAWVESEVAHFVAELPERPLIAFVTDSVPSASGAAEWRESCLTPTLRARLEVGRLEVVDATAEGGGFVRGVAQVASRIVGLDTDLLLRAETRRRRRLAAMTGAVMATAGLLAIVILWMAVAAGAGWLIAFNGALAAFEESQKGISELWGLSLHPGPMTRLNREMWQSLDERLGSTLGLVPATAMVPSGDSFLRMTHAGMVLERSNLAGTLGEYQEALLLAQEGRRSADHLLATSRGAFSRFVERSFHSNEFEISRRLLDLRAWLMLSSAQDEAGDFSEALNSANAALKAGEHVWLQPEFRDLDRFHYLLAARNLAWVSREWDEGPFNWRKGFALAAGIADRIPRNGKMDNGGSWSEVRASYLAQVHAAEAAVAASWNEEAQAHRAIAQAETAMRSMTQGSADAQTVSLLRMLLNEARSELAVSSADWLRVAESAAVLEKDFADLDVEGEDLPPRRLVVAGNLMTLARARARVGKDFLPMMRRALQIAESTFEEFPENRNFRLSLASLQTQAAEILEQASECTASRDFRRMARIHLDSLLEEKFKETRCRRLVSKLEAGNSCN